MKMKGREFVGYTAPSLIVMTVLMIGPLILTIYLSFNHFTFGSAAKFAGWSNYIEILKSTRFWDATGFTLVVTMVTTAIKMLIGFGVALLLYNVKRFRGAFIAGSLLPFIVPPVVGTLIFSWLFRQDWGFYSFLLSKIGIDISWYSNPWAAKWLIVIQWVWQGVSFVFLVLYAGLQAMPKDYMEAALVDGANYMQRLFHIVIPYLKPLILFTSMINIMDAYRIFDSIAVMTKGGPGTATESLMYYNYDIAFNQLSLGTGSAISILTLICIFVLMIPFLYWTYKEQTDK